MRASTTRCSPSRPLPTVGDRQRALTRSLRPPQRHRVRAPNEARPPWPAPARTELRAWGRRMLPVCVGVFGVGLIAAGVFTMDPHNGFPVGTPDRPVAQMSWHGVAHSASAAIALLALAVTAVALAVRCVRRGAVLPAVLNGVVAFTWTTVVAMSLRRRWPRSPSTRGSSGSCSTPVSSSAPRSWGIRRSVPRSTGHWTARWRPTDRSPS
ncbi:DUF998 domain-containing protein [Streptomyces anulatus]|uniref:DUF998 domain-containing protein n=1 Tax=Streptomyces anulatus TaxID=1892 RepID=UPI0037939FAA